MTGQLTDRQASIFRWIRSRILETNLPPTSREIAAAFEMSSANGAFRHLRVLEAKGFIEVLRLTSRGIKLTELGRNFGEMMRV